VTIMRRLVLAGLIFSVGLVALGAVAQTASAGGLRLTSVEVAVVKIINQTRAQHGLRPVRVRTSLCRAARVHSTEMVRRGFFSHLSFNGESQATRVVRFGYARKGRSFWSTGEVIAYGTGPAGTPQAIVDSWLQSKAHRALLLSPRWRDVGVGRASGAFRCLNGAAVYTVDVGRRTR
jgi:uncharacterized protein YkwD